MLFIDEVDVFFEKKFYGSTYSPLAVLKEKSIQDVIRFIWAKHLEDKHSKITTDVWKSEEYKKVKEAFPTWIKLIDEGIKGMCSDVS